MKAAYVEAPRVTSVRDIERPRAEDREVLIRVNYAGICGSDLHIYKGIHAFRKPPVMLGHELAGVVESVGNKVTKFQHGDRVTVMPQIGCGHCRMCNAGNPNICTTKRVPGMNGWVGSFVEYFNAPEDIVVKLPDAVTLEVGALSEPLAVAVHVVKQISEGNRGSLVVLGSGTIGMMIVAIAPFFGIRKVLATDALDYNLVAVRDLGAAKTVNILKENLQDAIAETFEGEKADAVVIAAAAPNIIDQAIESVRPHGEIIYLSMITKPMTANTFPIVFQELTIKGSQTYTMEDFSDAVKLLVSQKVDFHRFITHIFELERVQEAMELADEKTEDSIKIMIRV
ncbi:MAG: zinc-binding dehydrogenase [Negativicutes bacterium]